MESLRIIREKKYALKDQLLRMEGRRLDARGRGQSNLATSYGITVHELQLKISLLEELETEIKHHRKTQPKGEQDAHTTRRGWKLRGRTG